MPAAKAARLQRLPRPRRLQTLPTFSPSIAHQGYERPGAKKLDLHQAVNQAPCCRPSVRVDVRVITVAVAPLSILEGLPPHLELRLRRRSSGIRTFAVLRPSGRSGFLFPYR
jgi:hypothetical protein